MKPRQITIIGGGLAGLTLGIALRRADVPVVIWEAGHYPRHRVCGEFISGAGQKSLESLGLRKLLLDAGARLAETAAFFSPQKRIGIRHLPQPALCLSRFALDALLAKQFRELGGELREGARWTEKGFGEGVIRASGRRRQIHVKGWRWFGIKVHAIDFPLEADLEMHFRDNGYVGLCRLPEGRVNICGLLRSRGALPELSGDWKTVFFGDDRSPLARRLAGAAFDRNSFCSVAGIDLQPRRGDDCSECAIGDALTMIPPLTGNGMSMAFESAEVAREPLRRFSHGETVWDAARREIAQQCDQRFARRLLVASWLQAGLMRNFVREIFLRTISQVPSLWRLVFANTR